MKDGAAAVATVALVCLILTGALLLMVLRDVAIWVAQYPWTIVDIVHGARP